MFRRFTYFIDVELSPAVHSIHFFYPFLPSSLLSLLLPTLSSLHLSFFLVSLSLSLALSCCVVQTYSACTLSSFSRDSLVRGSRGNYRIESKVNYEELQTQVLPRRSRARIS